MTPTVFSFFQAAAKRQISANDCALREAPPTKTPPVSEHDKMSATLRSWTLPPYSIVILSPNAVV